MHTQNKSTAAGHTAGPWITEESDRIIQITDSATEGHNIALIHLPSSRDDEWGVRCEYRKNARLIASAPELLEALVELLEHEGQRVVNGIGLEDDSDELRAVKEQARAAIARAKAQ